MDWNIAGLGAKTEFIHPLILQNMVAKNPIPIKYVYGGICSVLAGGRFSIGSFFPELFMSEVNFFNYAKVGVRLTLSNTLVEETDLDDEPANFALDYLNKMSAKYKVKNGVIICSDLLRKYVKENYSNLETICSHVRVAKDTNFFLDTTNYYNERLSEFDIVVVNTPRVFDLNFLRAIDDVSRLEVIANYRCMASCPFAATHYDIVSAVNKGIDVENNIERANMLTHNCGVFFRDERDVIKLSKDQIDELKSNGIVHFKLAGREYPDEMYASDLREYLGVNFSAI